MNDQFDEYKAMIEDYLGNCFTNRSVPHVKLLESMRYSLLAGGKRIRPILTLEFCRVCGGDVKAALPLACAVEMLHTYSLIHDDLPCMDNDDLRRGKPTNHKIYGESVAVLAGDALQAEAFKTILSSALPLDIRTQCALVLAEAAGEGGICGGQYMDISGAQGKGIRSGEELTDMCIRKTASMIAAACYMGALSGRADKTQLKAARNYGLDIGLAFQIRDDILDETGSEKDLGKPIGSDTREGKITFISLYGRDACEEKMRFLTERAKASIAGSFDNAELLIELADELCIRQG